MVGHTRFSIFPRFNESCRIIVKGKPLKGVQLESGAGKQRAGDKRRLNKNQETEKSTVLRKRTKVVKSNFINCNII